MAAAVGPNTLSFCTCVLVVLDIGHSLAGAIAASRATCVFLSCERREYCGFVSRLISRRLAAFRALNKQISVCMYLSDGWDCNVVSIALVDWAALDDTCANQGALHSGTVFVWWRTETP